MHGEKDMRVPLYQGEMFYRALKEQGTPVEMVRYPGAPHWFGGAVGTAYEEDVQRRVLDWLDRHLNAPVEANARAVPGEAERP
jgi:dipeptidyl aminopeptidase/acylaminoacyl peptidase